MKNFYLNHVEFLRKNGNRKGPLVSLYVPLRNSELSPGKIFSALLRSANTIKHKLPETPPTIHEPDWNLWIGQGAQTLGVFASEEATTLVPLPVKMAPRIVVADSYHIKPLLAAARESLHALLLCSGAGGISLYRIDDAGATLVRHYLSEPILRSLEGSTRFLLREILAEKNSETSLIAIACEETLSKQLRHSLQDSQAGIIDLGKSAPMNLTQKIASVRLRLDDLRRNQFRSTVQHCMGLETRDLLLDSHLIRDIRLRKIKRLCVSLDCLRFGRIDRRTGSIVLYRSQRDLRDDDVLDDLAEYSLDCGVEVSVVPKLYLPPGLSLIAA